MSKPVRLSDLLPERQALVRLCQTINFGNIEDLKVGPESSRICGDDAVPRC